MAKLDIKGSLKRKIGPQPAWAWLAEGAAGLWWWRKSHAGTMPSASSSTAAYDPYAAAGGYTGDGSGIGSGGGSSGSGDPGTGLGAPTTAQQPAPDPGSVSGVPTNGVVDNGPGGDMPWSGSGAKSTGLSWGGQTFTSQAAFNAYLKKNGLSLAGFAAKHPAAFALYLTLPKGGKVGGALRSKLTGKKKAHATSAKKRKVSAAVKKSSAPRRRVTKTQATPHHADTRSGPTVQSQGKQARHRAATHHPAPKAEAKQSRVRGSHGGAEAVQRAGNPVPATPQARNPIARPRLTTHHAPHAVQTTEPASGVVRSTQRRQRRSPARHVVTHRSRR